MNKYEVFFSDGSSFVIYASSKSDAEYKAKNIYSYKTVSYTSFV